LPSTASDIEIDYTALSLAAPGRVQFRYRLLGVDRDWVDPGQRRAAFYTNLWPGRYTFQVIAANNDGVWNRQGATLVFTLAPAFYQTSWFFAGIAVVAALFLAALYMTRVRALERRIELRLEDRITERERIARELHDTLLQGFQGLLMRFQSVAEQMPPGQPARRLLDEAMDRADQVLIEGRDRVRSLRSQESSGDCIDQIEAAAHRLRIDPAVSIETCEIGGRRHLHPVVCEELLKIAEEALFNAYKHAQARNIAVAMKYGKVDAELTIADDGVGIDAAYVSAEGRTGHYGLTGMRERAHKLEGELSVQRLEPGTLVRVRVPGRIAYAKVRRGWRKWASRLRWDYQQ
jgi:signal transduction histidine kinase